MVKVVRARTRLASVLGWGCLVSVMAPVVIGQSPPAPADGAAPILVGVYRPGERPGDVNMYQSWLGRPVHYGQLIQGSGNWSQVEGRDGLFDPWTGAQRQIMVSVTVLPGPRDRSGVGDGPVSLGACGDGRYDVHFAALGRSLMSHQRQYAILRPLREFNGDWYAWGVHDSDDLGRFERDFTRCWRRFVDRLRSTPGSAFKFNWNPIVGPRRRDPSGNFWDPARAYPGDAYVDYVGVDLYDGGYPAGANETQLQQLRPANWKAKLDGPQGLRFWSQFAKGRSDPKPLSVPEWGLLLWRPGGAYRGGGDNAYFVDQMHAFITDPANRVHDHGFWEDRGRGVFDPDTARVRDPYIPVPRARARFLALFGPR